MTAGAANAQNRSLKLYFMHTKEKAEITYKVNGKYIDSGLKRINRFLRDWRRDEPTKMDPQLLDLLWEVYRQSGSKDYIHVVSAYRSPATNKLLRSRSKGVAKNSQHTLGKAVDYFIPDVKLSKVREIGLKLGVGGVGYYPTSGSPFVHMDTGRVRHWPRMTRKQLVKIFPRGNTLHVPSDGKPLPGYEAAVARHKAQRTKAKNIVVVKAEEPKKPGFFERLALARKERQKSAEEKTAIASTSQSAPPVDGEAGGPGAPPLPASAPRNPAGSGGTELALASVASDGEEAFPEIVPVPSRRPGLRPSDRLLDETRQLLMAARQSNQSTETASLSPGEIEDLRRSVAVEIEPERFASAGSQQASLQSQANSNSNQSQASIFAISSPAQAGTPIAAVAREPDIATTNPAAATYTPVKAPRPQNNVPVVALLENNQSNNGLRTSVDAANRLAAAPTRPQLSSSGPVLKRPVPAAGVPQTAPQMRKAIDNVEYGYTGTIASAGQGNSPIGTTGTEIPSDRTLQLALAATETDSSASQAIRALVNSKKQIEQAALKEKKNKAEQVAGLKPMDDKMFKSAYPLPQPRPVPASQTEFGQAIATTTTSEKTGQETAAIATRQTAQRGYLGQWALASEVPIGMITRLSPPSYGKLAYLKTESRHLTVGFTKTEPQYQPGRMSPQSHLDGFNNLTR
ncbi:MAG: DUF882 domain-containing protein [Rhizobiaceae bacterium]